MVGSSDLAAFAAKVEKEVGAGLKAKGIPLKRFLPYTFGGGDRIVGRCEAADTENKIQFVLDKRNGAIGFEEIALEYDEAIQKLLPEDAQIIYYEASQKGLTGWCRMRDAKIHEFTIADGVATVS